jgi:ABC-type multidrug transport system ATPase subunit
MPVYILISEYYSFDCRDKNTNHSSNLTKNNRLIQAEQIQFSIPDRKRKILDIPRLWLEQGKIVFVLGNNGAGKSSLLHFLAGRLYLPEARISVKGKLLPPLSEKLMPGYRGIELIRQEPDLNPHFLVEEELDRHLRVFDPATSEKKKRHYIKTFKLRPILRQKTGSISGGERRRLALACAMVGSPELILLDEPFSDLDSEGRNLLTRLILELASQGIAFLIVSHNGADSHWLADEIWTLDSGRIIERMQRQEKGFSPARYKSASLLGIRNILPLSEFPDWRQAGFTRMAFPEHVIRPLEKDMLSLGKSTLLRKRSEAGQWKTMWKTNSGLIYGASEQMPVHREGEELELGIRREDIFFLK